MSAGKFLMEFETRSLMEFFLYCEFPLVDLPYISASLLQQDFESNWFCNSNEYNFYNYRINLCGCPFGKLLVLQEGYFYI